jgi:transaldolase
MSINPRLARLRGAGVSIWLDTLSRQLLESGEFAELVASYGVTGATSNPTIFAQAITSSDRYDQQLQELAREGAEDPRELFFSLAFDDIRRAADLLRRCYQDTAGRDGFVSFECTPEVADDTEATVTQALDLWHRLDRANVMIKVPGTEAGLSAIEQLTRMGVNVNVTLLFSIERYEQVIESYLRGLEARAREERPLEHVVSAASFFLSRIDTKVDPHLPPDSPLRGQVAVASARVAYQRFTSAFSSARWQRLARLGAHHQRPLWASTGTKNADYSDVLYVSELIGPRVINTMPIPTLRAFADHGTVRPTLDCGVQATRILHRAAAAGLDLPVLTNELEREAVQAFCQSYGQLLDCIRSKLAVVSVGETG